MPSLRARRSPRAGWRIALAAGLATTALTTGALTRSADAYVATPAARHVINQLFNASQGLAVEVSTATGGLFYCVHPGHEPTTYLGPQPPSGCHHPAVQRTELDLAYGYVLRSVTLVSSRSEPTATIVADATGVYESATPAGCWVRTHAAPIPYRPNVFLADERMTAARTAAGQIALRGVAPNLSETDLINPRTHLITSLRQTERVGRARVRQTFVLSYPAQQSAPVSPTPACS